MKQYNCKFINKVDFQDFINKSGIDTRKNNILLQIFTSLSSLQKIQIVVDEIYSVFPNAIIIGASSAGEILNGEMIDNNTIVSISVFERTTVKGFYVIEEDSYLLGQKLSKKIFDKDTKCVISFLNGLQHNGQEYLHGLCAHNLNNAVIAGGMAADLLYFNQTYTIFANKVFQGGAVCAALAGDGLEVSQDYNLGWRAVGPVFHITKSDGIRVYEIDNRPVKEVYAEVLGKFAVENMPASTIEFPLIRKENDMLIARSILNVFEDGSILYGGDLGEGEEVRFGIGSRTLVNQYEMKKDDTTANDPQACFIYSCIARKQFLDKELEKVFRSLEQRVPTSGFFTFGEFFFNEEKAKLLNITTTMLFLKEKNTQTLRHELNEKRRYTDRSKTDGALFNLIDYVTEELKEQEKRFRASKFKLDEFLKALDSVIIISRTDTLGNITYVNERFEEVSGYLKEELIGKPHSIVRDPDVADKVFEELWHEITRGNIWQGEFSNIAKDGSSYYVKSSIIPIHDENNKIIEYMSIREDVSTLVKSRKNAEEAEAAQAMFLANMSHEIRTPMNGILGFTELLAKKKMDATQKKYVNVIRNSTKILLDIVNDILDSSKIVNQKILLEKVPINPFEEFTSTFELMHSIAQEKSLEYTLTIDENISKCIYTDSTRLRQVMINLLSNAIKFTPEYGKVSLNISLIETRKKQQKIHFSFEDSGIGIIKEKIEEIFKPFTQAEASTTRKFGGTGLGLSISADLIHHFGSRLEVKSQQNIGSHFFFDLVFDICEKEELNVEKGIHKEVCKNEIECDRFCMNILVAEDYDVNRMLIEAIFQKYRNIDLEFAFNGKEAVEKIKHHDYDLVFMDINMPVMNGINAVKKVREELQSDVIIIALTANAIKGDKEKFIAQGMNEYLSKPIDIAKLETILCKYSKNDGQQGFIDMEPILLELSKKVGLNKEVGIKLIKLFIESLEELVPRLEAAMQQKNIDNVYSTAHKLKGAAAALYIDEVVNSMEELEQSALAKNIQDHGGKVTFLYDFMNKLRTGVLKYH